MREKGFTRPRMDFDSLAGGESPPARFVVNLGDVFVTPGTGVEARKPRGEGFAHDLVRAFPDHERGCSGREPDHRNAEDEAVVLAQVASARAALGEQAVDMRGIALAPVTRSRGRLARHRPRVTGKADRHLGGIPGDVTQSEFDGDKIDRATGKFGAAGDAPARVVGQRVDPGEPGILVAIPTGLGGIAQARAGRRQGCFDPGAEYRVEFEPTPAAAEEMFARIAHGGGDAIMPRSIF